MQSLISTYSDIPSPIRTGTLAALCLLVLCGLTSAADPASAQETLSPALADRLGLVQMWQQQLPAPGGLQTIVDTQLLVDQENLRKYKEVHVTRDGKRVLVARIPYEQVDGRGNYVTEAEANRLALIEKLSLRRGGEVGEVSEFTSPEVRLYCLTTRGTLEARDAETGLRLWSNRLGSPTKPYYGLGVSKQGVAFVNGSVVHRLDDRTGKQLDFSPKRSTLDFSEGRGGRLIATSAPITTYTRSVIAGRPVNVNKWTIFPVREQGFEAHQMVRATDPHHRQSVAGDLTGPVAVSPDSALIMFPT
ncbi:MAG: hypothetical protein AAFP90_12950, partial [Planctomycetota bacterium]